MEPIRTDIINKVNFSLVCTTFHLKLVVYIDFVYELLFYLGYGEIDVRARIRGLGLICDGKRCNIATRWRAFVNLKTTKLSKPRMNQRNRIEY